MRMTLVASCIVVAAGAATPPAAAQDRAAFAAAAADLTAALEGLNGDDGSRVAGALDAMARALTGWDRVLRDLEDEVASLTGGASPQAAARLRMRLGLVYHERGRARDALRELEAASRHEPGEATPHFLRGLVLYELEGPPPAVPAFVRAFELDRADAVKAYWVVQSLHDAGTRDDAADALDSLVAAYQRAADRETGAASLPFLDLALFHDGAGVAALFPLQAYRQGYALLAGREYRRALAELREAAAADPLLTDPALREAAVTQAADDVRQGRAAAALARLEGVATKYPDSSEVYRLLGLALRRVDRLSESVPHLRRAVRLGPRNERAHRDLVAALVAMAERDSAAVPRARQALDEALAAFPESGVLHWMAAGLHRDIDGEQTRRQLQAAYASLPITGTRRILAEIGRLQNDPDEVARTFRRAVLASPNDAQAHVDLGVIYRMQGMLGPALASFVAAVLLAPDIADAHTAVGQLLLAMGRVDAAAAAFRRALALESGQREAHYGLASALLRLGRPDEARTALERFERLQRAALEDVRQDMERSRSAREAALEQDVATWEAIVAREPANPVHRLRLAEAFLRSGRLDLAVGHLEQAAVSGAPPDVYRQLTEVYAALGRAEDSARAHAEYESRRAAVTSPRATGN